MSFLAVFCLALPHNDNFMAPVVPLLSFFVLFTTPRRQNRNYKTHKLFLVNNFIKSQNALFFWFIFSFLKILMLYCFPPKYFYCLTKNVDIFKNFKLNCRTFFIMKIPEKHKDKYDQQSLLDIFIIMIHVKLHMCPKMWTQHTHIHTYSSQMI